MDRYPDIGEVLLQPGSLFERWARRAKAPCCVFTAIWLSEVARLGNDGSRAPTVDAEDMPWREAMDRAISAYGLEWWGKANNWAGEGVWATVSALPGGWAPDDVIHYTGTEVDVSVIPPGRWAIHQHWDLTKDTGGHTQLYRRNEDGSLTLHHSDEKRGYRTSTQAPGASTVLGGARKRIARGLLPLALTDARQC